jgi:type IV pilus assembly protein PilX
MKPSPTLLLSRKPLPRESRKVHKKEQGLVLIVSIVLLAIVSILAALSTRNAASAEGVSGNVRLTELATQAAEIALRHCEDSVAEVIATAAGGTSTYDTTFTLANILPNGQESSWESPVGWDAAVAHVFVLPLNRVNQPGLSPTYKRPPECMVARMPFVLPDGSISTETAFVITARGFGPDVQAADAERRRPVGSEVWLQSNIELQ